MSDYSDFTKEELLKFAKFVGFGFYRVTEAGQFVECDERARKIFGIPRNENDLSKHSILELYVTPREREWRKSKLEKNKGEPLCSTLSLRINGENTLLFDMCWFDSSYQDQGNFVGLVSKIEERTLFPKMFDTFPMGLYEVDDKNRIVRVNKKMLEIFGYKNETDILGTDIKDLYEEEADEEKFSVEIKEKGFAHDILLVKDANNKTLDIECFSQNIYPYEKARWGMMTDVTRRESYYRALDYMPTGYYHVEHEKITHCNDQFARILGLEKKEDAVGINMAEVFHPDEKASEKLFKDLQAADEKGEPLRNYEFETIRINDKKKIWISIDVHFFKDRRGKVIGREGTIRDISEKVELKEKVEKTEKRINEITEDLNNLIHTFLHPVLKFSGHAELFHQLGKILLKSIRHKEPEKSDIQKLGEELENKLIEIQKGLKDISDVFEMAAVLAPKFETIINVLDYDLEKAEGSKILVDKATRDAALWLLEELDLIGFFNENIKKGKLVEVITDDFIEYLQNILFDYLIRTANILQSETRMMRREVEALRRYIEVGQKRLYSFRRCNLGKILEENIEVFKPVLAQKDIDIEFTPPTNLYASISEIDIDRVICNLLHNANKYSKKGPGYVLKVRARDLQQENEVEIMISSLGIPITKREIENNDIFKFGYRGKLAFQTDRDGTGVGLADAWDVIEQHHGKITITSEPIRDDGDPPQYRVPYITTVTVRLPKAVE
jgi:PAS domain S-box-containing protein